MNFPSTKEEGGLDKAHGLGVLSTPNFSFGMNRFNGEVGILFFCLCDCDNGVVLAEPIISNLRPAGQGHQAMSGVVGKLLITLNRLEFQESSINEESHQPTPQGYLSEPQFTILKTIADNLIRLNHFLSFW